jgi:hypothetical protein
VASRWRTRVLLSAVLATFACEVDDGYGSSTLEIAVRLEPSLQAATSFPAQLLVGFDSSGSGYVVFRIGFLCAPDARFPMTATFPGSGDGPTAVDAWIVPFDGRAPFACGPLAAPQPVPFRGRPGGAPSTSAQVEVLGGCGNGDVRSATLVIAGSS